MKDKKYCKVRDHCYYTGEYSGAAHFIRNLKYSVPKKISILFHNGSNYDYHFMIIELAEEFKKQFTCLWEHTEKYVTFTVSIKKKSYSLSNFVNNFSEGIHRIKCKFGHHDKKCEIFGIEYKYCNWYLEYKNFKDDLIEYKCLFCNKNYQHKFDKS